MKQQRFGIEIEMTGITRATAAKIIASYFGTRYNHVGGVYDKYLVNDTTGRAWSIVSDSSIKTTLKDGSSASKFYSVELVSPICNYSDIETIQEIIRELRKGGAKVNTSCGIHVHIDGATHTPQTVRNLANIVYGKDHVLYKALNIAATRFGYCREVNKTFLDELNKKKPTTMAGVADIWYDGQSEYIRCRHYNDTRYRGLNLHNLLAPNGKKTVEFRLFNSTLHAGEIKTYIQFCLAINNQALVQKRANAKQTSCELNERYFFNCWLKRLGLTGEEFKTARFHLLKHLVGSLERYNTVA